MTGEMSEKIPTWGENSGRGKRKKTGKNSGMVENTSQGERKRLSVHGNFSIAGFLLRLLYVSV
jgi:hypothetical protein